MYTAEKFLDVQYLIYSCLNYALINRLLFLLCMNEDMLAPPIKQKARFKIKDAKCHLRPRNKEKHRDSSKQNPQGE